jgi:hypothetical protein
VESIIQSGADDHRSHEKYHITGMFFLARTQEHACTHVQERRATRTHNKHKHISAQQLNIGTPQSLAQQLSSMLLSLRLGLSNI